MGTRNAGGVDRISRLPSDILERILFFTGVRQAVQLSVLSSTWKNLWKAMPDLYFDARDFPPTSDQNWRLFHFARRVLELRTWRTRELRIVVYEDIHQQIRISPREWFNFAAQCRAEEQSLSYLPHSSSSPTSGIVNENPSIIIVFGMLRRLSISGMCEPFSAFEPPSDACSLLEKLSIVGCSFDSVNISFSRLKHLTLHDCGVFRGIRVAAPSLESFDYRQGFSRDCKLENLPSLRHASLRHASIDIYRGNWSCDALLGVLRAIQNATSITLPWWNLEAYYKQQGSFSCLPTFHNAKHVTLVSCGQRNIVLIKDLLQKCPNIETLTTRREVYTK
uniref:F-box protein At5g03100-like n=1 Tax=Elaeis guineensis var. tenera TaxID=51953 RepID=A0A6I9QDM8_ELAGV|nr:F-box protein At5g03100-like [Elaeis guineensis]